MHLYLCNRRRITLDEGQPKVQTGESQMRAEQYRTEQKKFRIRQSSKLRVSHNVQRNAVCFETLQMNTAITEGRIIKC